MSHIKSFTVGSATYNAVMASAVKQDELLSILTPAIMERAFVAARSGFDVEETVIVPLFMAMPTESKRRAADILMHQVVLNGTERKITVEDFTGKMVEYNTLLARLLEFNLADFFVWLRAAVAGVRPENQEKKAL